MLADHKRLGRKRCFQLTAKNNRRNPSRNNRAGTCLGTGWSGRARDRLATSWGRTGYAREGLAGSWPAIGWIETFPSRTLAGRGGRLGRGVAGNTVRLL